MQGLGHSLNLGLLMLIQRAHIYLPGRCAVLMFKQ